MRRSAALPAGAAAAWWLSACAACLGGAVTSAWAQPAPAEGAPAEETPAEETPVEEAPAEETPAEDTPVEEAPAEETPAEEAPAEEATAEEATVEEASAEEPPVEEAPAEEPATGPVEGAPPQQPRTPDGTPAAAPQPTDPGLAGAAEAEGEGKGKGKGRATPAAGLSAETEAGTEPRAGDGEPGGEDDAAAGLRGANVDADRPGITGSLIYWGHSVSAGTLARGQQPSYNPQYTWTFDSVLRWNFNRLANLRVLQGAAVEMTSSELTTEPQQLLFGDTRLRFTYELPRTTLSDTHQLRYFAAVENAFPTSKASRAATLVLGPSVRALMAWMSSAPLSGMQNWLLLAARGNVHTYQTGVIDDPIPCRVVTSPSAFDCRRGILANTAWALTVATQHTLNLTASMWATASFSYTWSRAFGFEAFDVPVQTGSVRVGDGSTTHFRNVGVVGLSFSYMPTAYLIVAAEMNNAFPERGPDGAFRYPFDAQDVFVGASLMVLIEPLLPTSLTRPDA